MKRKKKLLTNAGNAELLQKERLQIFQCIKPIQLQLTKKACAHMYHQANKTNKNGVSAINHTIDSFYYCFECPEGKKNYEKYHSNGKEKIKAPKRKQCLMYQVDPTQCKNEKIEGWFSRHRTQKDQNWGIKRFCCAECGVRYHYLKSQGKIK